MRLYNGARNNIFAIIFAYFVAFIVYCAVWCVACLVLKTFMITVLRMMNSWQYVLAFLLIMCIVFCDVRYIKSVVKDAEDRRDEVLFVVLVTLSGIASLPLVVCMDSVILFSIAISIIVLCVIAGNIHSYKCEG